MICVGGSGDFPLRSRRFPQTRRKGPVTITGHGESTLWRFVSRSQPIPSAAVATMSARGRVSAGRRTVKRAAARGLSVAISPDLRQTAAQTSGRRMRPISLPSLVKHRNTLTVWAMRGRARAREALGADHLDDAGEHRGAGGRLRGDCENAFDELKTRAPSGDLALGVECGEAVCNWVGWSRPA